VLLVLNAAGCARTIRGEVLDAVTKQPIQGAVVLGVWTEGAGPPGLHYHKLIGVREAETDEGGRFVLERLSFPTDEYDEAITVYRFGYIAWSNLFIFPTMERRKGSRVPAQILLERFPSGESHRRHVFFIDDATMAGMYGRERIRMFRDAVRREEELR
jgi:hypothetical protein